ncbi:MAG: hypothetical protein AAF762_09265, partial [Pseudomonadota bacterium]
MSVAKRIHRVSLEVAEVNVLSPTIREYVLRDEEGWPLPPFSAGAHIDVHVPGIGVRQYSLAGDPAQGDEWRIVVQRDDAGRGGSRAVHETFQVGTEVLCSLPRNMFPFPDNVPVTMIAGGIGITPFLSAMPVLARTGQKAKLIYCTRTRADAVFADRVGDEALYISAEQGRASLSNIIEELSADAHLFVCGPAAMISEAQERGAHLGARLHVEHFSAETGADPAYSIELARQGEVRILCVTAPERVEAAADVPTCSEAGADGVEFVNWRGFFGAPGLTDEQSMAYQDALGAMYDTEAWATVRDRNGWVEIYNPGEDFT